MEWMKKIARQLQKLMVGRYGVDQLSMGILGLVLILLLIGAIIDSPIFSLMGTILIVGCYFRIFSKQINKRQQENYKFLRAWYPIRDKYLKGYQRLKGMKTYKYFKCQECKQSLRVPRGKGKIKVTCPKCHHEMHKKS